MGAVRQSFRSPARWTNPGPSAKLRPTHAVPSLPSCRRTALLSAPGLCPAVAGLVLSSLAAQPQTPPPDEASPETPPFVSSPSEEQIAFFEKRIRPVLAENCYECHSASSDPLEGGLLLDSRAGLMKGGDSGPVATAGDPESSLLIHAIRYVDPDLAMPPKKKLPPEVIADLEEWVRQRLPDPRSADTVATVESRNAIDWETARNWWSFQPIVSPALPTVQNEDWPANELDLFVLARLEENGLTPAAGAGKRVLIRRVTYGLTGLPPSPAEAEAFLNDQAPGAFARVVDRLLQTPAYGERWARHWLDVVRYADTAGDNSDFPVPQHYRYRNWVIDAFQRDLPYDQFVREQLAGDLLPSEDEPEARNRLVATGYLANARRFGSRVDDYPQHLTIEDTIDNLGRTFLGLTINCARCHDHKFDPISAEDYYALYGIFRSTRYPWPGIELDQRQRDLVPLASPAEIAEAEEAHRQQEEQWKARLSEVQQEFDAAEDGAKKKLRPVLDKAKQDLDAHVATPPPYERAYAVADASSIEDAAVQLKGDPSKEGPVVERRFLTVLGGERLPPDEAASGRRQLAEWIVDPGNPLAARVMVNRIWLHHFGRGLVPTPNDFGRQGQPPSHPELLDWLAFRFRESGWSIKAMHRLILLSQTYQQSSERPSACLTNDPANILLGGYPRRRLDAESIRDTLLLLGGALDPSQGGEHPFPPQNEWKFTQHNPFKAVYETDRRSVYLMTQRIQRHPFLATFDGADPAASTPVRSTSTTPLQALYFLNDPLVHEQSGRFASRILASGQEDAGRLRWAYAQALGRPPLDEEMLAAQRFLATVSGMLSETITSEETREKQSWQAFTRVLFQLNEFLYLD